MVTMFDQRRNGLVANRRWRLPGPLHRARRTVLATVACCAFSLAAVAPAAAAPLEWTTTAYTAIDQTPGASNIADAVGVDSAGNRYVTGRFGGSITFALGSGGTLTANGSQIYVASYNSAGVFRWARRIGSALGTEPGGMVVTPSGNVVVHGATFGAARISTPFGDRVLTTYGGWDSFTVVLAGNDGHIIWAQSQGGPGTERAGDAAVDNLGNIFITGSFSQTATFPSAPGADARTITSAGGGDAYVANFTPGGALRFVVNAAAGGQESKGTGLAVSAGAVFVVGRYTGAINLGGTTANSTKPGVYHGFVAQLWGNDGTVMWVRVARGLTNTDDGPLLRRITRASDGSLYIIGSFTDAIGYGPPGYPPGSTLANPTDTDGVLFHIRTTGELRRMRALGSSSSAFPNAVTAGPSASAVIVGTYQGVLALDGANLTTADVDGFVAQVSSAGAVDRASSFGGTAGDNGNGVAGAAGGNPVIAGFLGGSATLPGGTATSASGGFIAALAPA